MVMVSSGGRLVAGGIIPEDLSTPGGDEELGEVTEDFDTAVRSISANCWKHATTRTC